MGGGRVLMLAHHFPPAGGSGANRALAFARYLPAFGWRPVVITPDVGWAANADVRLLRELPRDVRVVRTGSLEARPSRASNHAPASSSQKPVRAWRRQLGHLKRFPDAHTGWVPFAVAAAGRQRYDVAYSSSGPFTSHVVGLVLKRRFGKPWVAELRDGWYRWNRAIFPDYPAWRDLLERQLEAMAIRSADRVVLVTERMARAFRQQYPDLPAERFSVVSNGFDPAQFETEPACATHSYGWTLLHAGALYYGRSVAALLQAVRRVSEIDAAFAKQFRLRLIGTLDGAARAELEAHGLQASIDVMPQMSHAEAIAAMRSADALLLVANTTPGAEATVPGKLFEYLALGKPVLAVAPGESSTADVLRQTGGGWLAEASDPDAIACALKRAYAERTTSRNADAVASFDRRRLTRELAGIFDALVHDASRV
jgi:glycosyltransferase involved in cell wall biosynthesis